MLSVTTGPEASQAMAGSSCAQNKKEKNAEICKGKPQAGKHSSQPKARERFNISVVQQTLGRPCFLKGYRASTGTSNEKQCTCLYMSERPDLPDGDTHTVNTGDRALSPSGGNQPWRQSEEAQAPAAPLERRGESPSSGRTVCRICQNPIGI